MLMSQVRYTGRELEVLNHAFQRAEVKKVCAEVEARETENCVNVPVPIQGICGVVARVPVVLAEFTVQAHVNAVIELPEYVFEIKRIQKRLKITQCLLIQDTNVLFIKGFVRKNIEYATRSCSNAQGFCGDVRHCTVDVPFSCTTPVTFNGIAPLPPVFSTSQEFIYSKQEPIFHPDFSEKDHLLSGDLRETNLITTEFYNELPYCDIVSSRIVEFDEQLQPISPRCADMPFEEKYFRRIEEKMVIFVTLKLLQNRQISIPPAAAFGPRPRTHEE